MQQKKFKSSESYFKENLLFLFEHICIMPNFIGLCSCKCSSNNRSIGSG